MNNTTNKLPNELILNNAQFKNEISHLLQTHSDKITKKQTVNSRRDKSTKMEAKEVLNHISDLQKQIAVNESLINDYFTEYEPSSSLPTNYKSLPANRRQTLLKTLRAELKNANAVFQMLRPIGGSEVANDEVFTKLLALDIDMLAIKDDINAVLETLDKEQTHTETFVNKGEQPFSLCESAMDTPDAVLDVDEPLIIGRGKTALKIIATETSSDTSIGRIPVNKVFTQNDSSGYHVYRDTGGFNPEFVSQILAADDTHQVIDELKNMLSDNDLTDKLLVRIIGSSRTADNLRLSENAYLADAKAVGSYISDIASSSFSHVSVELFGDLILHALEPLKIINPNSTRMLIEERREVIPGADVIEKMFVGEEILRTLETVDLQVRKLPSKTRFFTIDTFRDELYTIFYSLRRALNNVRNVWDQISDFGAIMAQYLVQVNATTSIDREHPLRLNSEVMSLLDGIADIEQVVQYGIASANTDCQASKFDFSRIVSRVIDALFRSNRYKIKSIKDALNHVSVTYIKDNEGSRIGLIIDAQTHFRPDVMVFDKFARPGLSAAYNIEQVPEASNHLNNNFNGLDLNFIERARQSLSSVIGQSSLSEAVVAVVNITPNEYRLLPLIANGYYEVLVADNHKSMFELNAGDITLAHPITHIHERIKNQIYRVCNVKITEDVVTSLFLSEHELRSSQTLEETRDFMRTITQSAIVRVPENFSRALSTLTDVDVDVEIGSSSVLKGQVSIWHMLGIRSVSELEFNVSPIARETMNAYISVILTTIDFVREYESQLPEELSNTAVVDQVRYHAIQPFMAFAKSDSGHVILSKFLEQATCKVDKLPTKLIKLLGNRRRHAAFMNSVSFQLILEALVQFDMMSIDDAAIVNKTFKRLMKTRLINDDFSLSV